MRVSAIVLVLGVSLSVAGTLPAVAAITYVDATVANTTLNGAALAQGVNHTTGSAEGPMDNSWHSRTGVGNGGSVWTSDELNSGSEDVAPLITTLTFLEAGAYRIFVYIWNSDEAGVDWDARVRRGSSSVWSKVQSSEAELANAESFNNSVLVAEDTRTLIQIPVGVAVVGSGGQAQVHVDDDATTAARRTWYDGVGYEKVFGNVGESLIAVDFNRSNAPGSPVQSMFRSVRGSSSTSQNSTNIVKSFGPYSVRLSKSSALQFDFRGANGDSTRTIPGGPTSLSFLVADFVGSRDGTINLSISNLSSGRYLFRSYHLDTLNASNFGYAQGSSSTTPNTLRAHIGGTLAGIIQPTTLGSVGLGTNFISDADIPTLNFAFDADGSNAVTINLSTLYTNGSDRFILLNGFEVFSTTP